MQRHTNNYFESLGLYPGCQVACERCGYNANPEYFDLYERVRQAAIDEYLAINGGCGSDSPEIIPGKEYQI